ncbi:alpha/beta hydrolase [Sphingomonas jatrophae]|uniref:Lysophospholipase, alpha-beta hydrolase superfamily n=1 Tax=Sphingomonas jatrophae TaxID=1166337 RepID=A0A1I6KF25_9SPHN|nr:hypothetical protein [Sphingomonas jatrophae]SFR89842.1 Lysophospholipase, alpha-beta hydrolase superfamily [Sphingomonas jatrophae]
MNANCVERGASHDHGGVRRVHRRVDVTAVAGIDQPAAMAAEILLPEGDARPRLLFVCLPGGGMNRRYFDLATPPGEAEVSFARAMLARGHAVALLDPLGVGESTVPDDAFLLHPDNMAAAIAVTAREILGALRGGTLAEGYPALPDIRSIGTGHSFGALLTTMQQAADPIHLAVALFGFQHRGLPDYLSDAERALPPAEARARLIELARARSPDPFITLQAPPSKRAISLSAAMDRVLTTPSLMALLPDAGAPDAAALDVPVLLALGDGDMHDQPHAAPALYRGSPDVTLLVLQDTRHNHFIYPSRTRLFDRVERWASSLADAG